MRALASRGALEYLDVRIVEAGSQRVVVQVPVTPRTHQPFGLLHGGVSAFLAETAASIGATMAAGPTKAAVGIEINASHLRAMRSGMLTAVATPLRVGRRIQVWDVALGDDDGHAICQARCTLAVVDRPPRP
jgi:uncharacterized protein (TIGR00369 family)